jgi:hypothetical protein
VAETREIGVGGLLRIEELRPWGCGVAKVSSTPPSGTSFPIDSSDQHCLPFLTSSKKSNVC